VPTKVLERRLRLLKELGANAIRTSHNPPAPELLDLCDRLGLLVKDEAFDEFTPAKNKWVSGRNLGEPSRFGYAELFDEWSVRDVQDMVRRDRNHPSVILWSIGNEIDYANDPFSHPVLGNSYRPANPPAEQLVTCARPLIAAVKALDATRPVTAALANVAMSDAVGLGEMLDVVGYNYQESRYAADHQKYPKRFIFGSENGGQLANWLVVRTNDYVAGQFLWTGIDYLGEANRFPNRGSSAGLLDVCGFKKPNAWFRQSLWSEKPMIYLCAMARSGGMRGPGGRGGGFGAQEHWNWPTNSEVTVRCYTTCPEVRLSLNDQAIGTKRLADAVEGALVWQVPFEPGVLKAVGIKDGKAECEFALRTVGAASRIELLPDATKLLADNQDVCHVEFRIVDAQGVRVVDGTNGVTFSAEGPAKIIGIDNGDLNSPETGKGGVRKAYRGRGLAIVQATREAGKIRIVARAEGLREGAVEIEAVAQERTKASNNRTSER
jgi:beta-galactosidase